VVTTAVAVGTMQVAQLEACLREDYLLRGVVVPQGHRARTSPPKVRFATSARLASR
jgi:hypothetical protein